MMLRYLLTWLRFWFRRTMIILYKTQAACILPLWNVYWLSSSQVQVRFSSELPSTFWASQSSQHLRASTFCLWIILCSLLMFCTTSGWKVTNLFWLHSFPSQKRILTKRTFLLDNRAKAIFLEWIPDCLGCDRTGKDVVDEMGGLHSIIKPPTGNMMNNWMLVNWRQFGRTSPFAVFFVSIHLLLDPPNGRLP